MISSYQFWKDIAEVLSYLTLAFSFVFGDASDNKLYNFILFILISFISISIIRMVEYRSMEKNTKNNPAKKNANTRNRAIKKAA